MKKFKSLIYLLCLGITTIAQKPVTIDGNFANDKQQPEIKLFKVADGTLEPIATTRPNDKGKFGFRFFPEYEGLYVIGAGRSLTPQGNQKFWLKPGDQLSIALTDSSYTLTGTANSKENQVLTQWYKMIWPLDWKSFYFGRANSTYVDFFPELNKLLPKAKTWMTTAPVTGNKKFNAALKDIVRLDLAYTSLNFLSTPRLAHPAKEEIPEYYAGLSVNGLFPVTSMVYTYPWGSRLFNQVFMKDQLNSGEQAQRGLAAMEQGFRLIDNDTLKGDMTLQYLARLKNYEDFLAYKNIAEKYILTDAQKKEEFRIDAALTELKQGAKGYEFKLEDKDGKMVAFTDLKGKVVLIDTWATWCAPCKVEIPHLKKLEEEMKGKEVAIVSISVDEENDKDKWRKMIADQNLGGIQLFAKGWSQFTKYYKITAIPRFLVFDKQGKVVTIDAPRPSSPDLKPLLEKYL